MARFKEKTLEDISSFPFGGTTDTSGVCSFVPILAVLYQVGVNISIVLL